MGKVESEDKVTIGEKSSIKIGLFIAILGVFASAVWFSSSVNEKLNAIIINQSAANMSIINLQNKLSDVELKVALHENSIRILQEKTTKFP